MTDGTKCDRKFMAWHAWRWACEEYSELSIPSKAKCHEDWRTEGLKAQNNNNWNDQAEQYLIDHDFVINK